MFTVITAKYKHTFKDKQQAENHFYEKAKVNKAPMLMLDEYGRTILTAFEGNFCNITWNDKE